MGSERLLINSKQCCINDKSRQTDHKTLTKKETKDKNGIEENKRRKRAAIVKLLCDADDNINCF